MLIPKNYAERVYAGVLGKIIGVYLGRPFEGWSYQKIMAELGEINYYVHEKLKVPLIVTDDDITGTFTFLRAMADYGYDRQITAEQIGKAWLNYLIEEKTILWWGGLGMSTEHTAYLRLKKGIPAPLSGSCELNGKVVSEQIGAQIFIDGWAMIAPGQPELAADLAWKAGSVSHDGEALYGAQVIAVMESLAFVESDMQNLLDQAVRYIPERSIIRQMIDDIRAWHASVPDWHDARSLLEEKYGYHIYGGNCHMIPNHGLIILSLLYGEDNFQKSLMIVNTSGWDTDCNSANVGCLLGIKNGLVGLETGPDWRGPVADRLYLPTADGGRAISDALTESYHIINMGRLLAGQTAVTPKNGARFHFSLPGSVQGFQIEDSIECRATGSVENVSGHSMAGQYSLAIHYRSVASARSCRAATPTFIPLESKKMGGYSLIASPTLFTGQKVSARISTDPGNAGSVEVRLYIRVYDAEDKLRIITGPGKNLRADEDLLLDWNIPDTEGYPIAEIGVQIAADTRTDGTIFLDYLTWSGQPELTLTRTTGGSMWQKAWVNGMDVFAVTDEPIRLIQNEGTGLIMQGTNEWQDYRVSTMIRPHLARSAGVGLRAQGMKRYYALLLCADQMIRLIRFFDQQTVMAEQSYSWEYGNDYHLSLEADGDTLRGWINSQLLFTVTDKQPITGGAAAIICEEGRISTDKVIITRAAQGAAQGDGSFVSL